MLFGFARFVGVLVSCRGIFSYEISGVLQGALFGLFLGSTRGGEAHSSTYFSPRPHHTVPATVHWVDSLSGENQV